MKNKVVIVGVSPLVQRRSDVFYIEPLRERGYIVEHCDLSPCFYNYTRYSDIIDESYALTFVSLNSFNTYLEEQDIQHTIFIVELLKEKELQPLFNLLRSRECFCIRINPNASDMTGEFLPVFTGIKRGCYSLSYLIKYPLIQLKKFIDKKIIDTFDYDIWSYHISSGKNPIINYHINQDDWIRARKELQRVNDVPESYAVFCDEYFPYHPDLEFFNLGDLDSIAKRYYTLMNQYFDTLERAYNVKFVIAGHPKSKYTGTEFGDRCIIKFKTAELVKHANFVVLHGSMSIAYAVLFDKPISIVITPDLKKFSISHIHQVQYSEYFQLPLYDLSKDLNAYPKRVSQNVKDKYIYDYMTSKGIENKDNIDLLDELFSKEIPFA